MCHAGTRLAQQAAHRTGLRGYGRPDRTDGQKAGTGKKQRDKNTKHDNQPFDPVPPAKVRLDSLWTSCG
jgi:hypothetical protein